jgi:hypothetical protein
MKNIHVLPTDKPSIICKIDNVLVLSKVGTITNDIKSFLIRQNIHVTSDVADINENDYIITKDGRLVQVSYLLSKDLQGASKIILTTDQDLIAVGVQPIEDEFLEWFVQNPRCEEVKVELHVGSLRWSDSKNTYKIIIPKEEFNIVILGENEVDLETKIIECLKEADDKLDANDFSRLAESIIDYIDEIARSKKDS